jgi:hypothetical protein
MLRRKSQRAYRSANQKLNSRAERLLGFPLYGEGPLRRSSSFPSLFRGQSRATNRKIIASRSGVLGAGVFSDELSPVRHRLAKIPPLRRSGIVGMRKFLSLESDHRSTASARGAITSPGLEEPAMFKLSAYDPVGIAIFAFGIVAVVALAFAY